MSDEPGGRKRVDLTTLPAWARALLVLATIALVVGLALLVGRPSTGPAVPLSAVVAAVVAFGFVAWRARHRR
ncbi:hypothetical protein B0I31_11648 [Saccharothrix carnea]|uniref:Uncharacterized protein n=1 Tax=Saccharothrix carnea TaxID=1280637 RepID=A0A2P8I0J2_SACCR|nr:hypothetical protein [Saccharothrix carnea]PSL51972.1 hypothetical protein B0I31_11648 [Saccharothrix carnea]